MLRERAEQDRVSGTGGESMCFGNRRRKHVFRKPAEQDRISETGGESMYSEIRRKSL